VLFYRYSTIEPVNEFCQRRDNVNPAPLIIGFDTIAPAVIADFVRE